MKKAGSILKVLFPNMLHVTCLGHSLHRISEHVLCLFPEVDKLIASVKQIFSKSPSRREIFNEMTPETPKIPKPVITRWGTWINAALYYAKYYDEVKAVVESLDEDEAASIEIAQSIFQKDSVKHDLTFIAAHIRGLPESITKLETRNLPLTESLEIFNLAVTEIASIPGTQGRSLRNKFKKIVEKNSDLPKLQKIAKILSGSREEFSLDYTPEQLISFMYAPVTSTEVERSFSIYKNLLLIKISSVYCLDRNILHNDCNVASLRSVFWHVLVNDLLVVF